MYQNHYSIWGERGLIKVNRAYAIPIDMKPQIEILKNENKKEIVIPIDVPAHNHFESIFREFCDLVLGRENLKKEINNKYSDILSQAKVLEAVRISSRKGQEIKMMEIK